MPAAALSIAETQAPYNTVYCPFGYTSNQADAGTAPTTAKLYRFLYAERALYITGFTAIVSVADSTPITLKAQFSTDSTGTSNATDLGNATNATAGAVSLSLLDNQGTTATDTNPIKVPAGAFVGFLTAGTVTNTKIVGVQIHYRYV